MHVLLFGRCASILPDGDRARDANSGIHLRDSLLLMFQAPVGAMLTRVTAPILMVETASPTQTDVVGKVVPTDASVASWYDAGVRLTANNATPPVAKPATADDATTADGLVWSTYDAAYTEAWKARPPPVPKEAGPRWAEWNPEGILFPGQADPNFKDQVVPEYVKCAPPYLNGKMAGDVGFDPLCLAVLAKPDKAAQGYALSAADRKAKMLSLSEEEQWKKVVWMKEAELKHARLAMLAAAGWPLAELCNGNWLKMAAGTNGRAPSLFNGGFFDFPIGPFVFLALAGAAYLEAQPSSLDKAEGLTPTGYMPGDYGFDPLGYASGDGPSIDGAPELPAGLPNFGKGRALQLAEIKHGRAAMVGITGFAVQEFVWRSPVVEQTPWFFGK